MKHQQVIENFIKEGKGGMGTYMKATDELLYSRVPSEEWISGQGYVKRNREAPLVVRLEDNGLLANGAAFRWPTTGHQESVLSALENTHANFGVVPFHSIVAAWTDGVNDDWDRAPIAISDLKKEVGIVVPSKGERWST